MTPCSRIVALTLALCAVLAGAARAAEAPGQARPRIEKAADLPRFSYAVPGPLEATVRSAERFAPLAAAAKQHAPGSQGWQAAVSEQIARELAPLPFNVIANDIRNAKARAETLGEGLVLGRVREVLQPVADAAGGRLSSEFAPSLAGARWALLNLLPLKATLVAVYTRYLDANKVDKPDIWAARDVVLSAEGPYQPVTVAVWDSGVDTALFGPRVVRAPTTSPR